MLGAQAIAAFGLATVLLFRILRPAPRVTVSIAAGNIEGMRCEHLQDFVSDDGDDRLHLKPVITRGTLDMLERVDGGDLDFALIQGGYDMRWSTGWSRRSTTSSNGPRRSARTGRPTPGRSMTCIVS